MSSKTMRCPMGALVTRTSAIPPKHPKKGAPKIVRTYRIEDAWSETIVTRKRDKNKRPSFSSHEVKHKRCAGRGPVERVDEGTLRMRCPEHGDVDMNAEIWAKEAGL